MEKKFSDMIQLSAKGSLILILGRMGATLISAIGTILIARILGSTSFGVISIAQIPVSVSLLLINNGVSDAVINYLAEYRHEGKEEELRSVVSAGFIINFVIGFLASIVLYLLSGLLANQIFQRAELEQLIKILSVSVLAQAILNTMLAVLAGFELMGRRSLIAVILSLVKSILGPGLVVLGYGVVGAAMGLSLPIIFAVIFGFIIIYYMLRELPSSPYRSLKRSLSLIFRFSFPLFFSRLLSGSLNKVFIFILPLYVSASIIGNYSVATSFSVLISIFTMPLNTATFPLLSKLKPDDGVFEYVFQNIIKYESMIVFPLASAIIALSDHLVNLLYGASYLYAPLFLRIFVLNFFFVGLGDTVTTNLLNSQKDTQVNFRRTLIYLVFGVPMGILLIPRLGVIGFFFTVILAPKIGLLYALWWIKKNYMISVDYDTIIRILISAGIGYVLCKAFLDIIVINLWMEFIFGGSILLVSYLVMILLTGALTKKNIADIYSIVGKYERFKPLMDPLFNVLNRISRK